MRADPVVLVFVGGGPRTVSLLERIAASAPELLPARELRIHIVDPFPAGGGRIWRRNQSRLLWMNSVAKDVTIFPDESVVCEGPIVSGPPLDEWVAGPGRQVLLDAGLARQANSLRPDHFASREIQSLYLSWSFDRIVSSLPPSVTVTTHLQRAVSVQDVRKDERSNGAPWSRVDGSAPPARQWVYLEDRTLLSADLVVLAQGYLDRTPTAEQTALTAAAARENLVYVPPGYTADIDLSPLRSGDRVLVRGFGLAFIDLMVLLFEGRGGRFVERTTGELTYAPSGAEPLLFVGSRRGVPYHAKLGYDIGISARVPPVYFTPRAVDELAGEDGTADFGTALWPLIVKELTHAHYRRLFESHPDRTTLPWPEFSAVLGASDTDASVFRQTVELAVPDPVDRFDLSAVDRPLQATFVDHEQLARRLVHYIQGDLNRRADPRHSPDHAVFDALLTVYGVLAEAVVAGRISAADRVRYVEGEFHGLFSFLASGPPPRRLAELLALHRAGLVHFVGPDLKAAVQEGRFVGWSPAVGGRVYADALVDARLPRPDVRAASDPIISGLLAAGELAAEDLVDDYGTDLGGGQLLADEYCRAVRADRTVHPHRFLLGPSVSGSAGSAGFSRPGFNGAGFRQNDRIARHLLRLAEGAATGAGTPRTPRTERPVPVRPTAPVHTHHTVSSTVRSEISHAR